MAVSGYFSEWLRGIFAAGRLLQNELHTLQFGVPRSFFPCHNINRNYLKPFEGQSGDFLLMKNFSSFVFMAAAMFCFGSAQAKVHECVENAGKQPCFEEVALICPTGLVDGCAIGKTKAHQCITRPGKEACVEEIAITCVPGFVDGCVNHTSTVHECVPKKGSESCVEEFGLVCPSGFQDSCGVPEPKNKSAAKAVDSNESEAPEPKAPVAAAPVQAPEEPPAPQNLNGTFGQ